MNDARFPTSHWHWEHTVTSLATANGREYVVMSITPRLCKPKPWHPHTDYGDGIGREKEENTQLVRSCGRSVAIISPKRLAARWWSRCMIVLMMHFPYPAFSSNSFPSCRFCGSPTFFFFLPNGVWCVVWCMVWYSDFYDGFPVGKFVVLFCVFDRSMIAGL